MMYENDRDVWTIVFTFLLTYALTRLLLRAIEVYGNHCYMDGVNDTKSIFWEIKARFEQQANRNDGAAEATE